MRTARQDSISGWDPEQIQNSSIGIVGTGPIAQFAAAYLTGLGIGDVRILDTRRGNAPDDFMIPELKARTEYRKQRTGSFGLQAYEACLPDDLKPYYHEVMERATVPVQIQPGRAEALADTMNEMNPNIVAQGDERPPLPPDLEDLLDDCDVLADLSNNPTYAEALDGLSDGKTLITACADRDSARIVKRPDWDRQQQRIEEKVREHLDPGRDTASYFRHAQGIIPSATAAAYVVDAARSAVMPLDHLGENKDLYRDISLDFSEPRLNGRKILVVGAGGIGTYVALNAALLGAEIDIADPDHVDLTNLNRQVLYTAKDASTLRPKAEAMVERLYNLKNGVYRPIVDSIGSKDVGFVADGGYDAIFSCVDNPESRKELSDLAVRSGVPLINGAVGPFDAVMDSYVPGSNNCLNCQNDSYRYAMREQRPAQEGCGAVKESSIVVTNAMAGAMMIDRANAIFTAQDSFSGKETPTDRVHFSGRVANYGMHHNPALRKNSGCAC